MPEVNGLAVTATRKALLRLIHAAGGQIYGEAGQVFYKPTYRRVTAEVKKLIAHEWVRALAPDEPRGPGETRATRVTYYRVLEYGRVALGLDQSSSEKESNG
jgi:hypothetical protein